MSVGVKKRDILWALHRLNERPMNIYEDCKVKKL